MSGNIEQPLVVIDDRIEAVDVGAAIELLPEWRRERVLALRREADRRQSVAAWLLLRRACRAMLGVDEVPAVRHTAAGKPYFVDLPAVHFSLSHCEAAAACALHTSPVGIDVEVVAPVDIDVARRVLNDSELAVVHTSDFPEVEFARLWTMKESAVKLMGTGLPDDPRQVPAAAQCRFSTTVAPGRRYVVTVAVV